MAAAAVIALEQQQEPEWRQQGDGGIICVCAEMGPVQKGEAGGGGGCARERLSSFAAVVLFPSSGFAVEAAAAWGTNVTFRTQSAVVWDAVPAVGQQMSLSLTRFGRACPRSALSTPI